MEYFNYSHTFSVTFWNRMGKDIRLFYKPADENQTHTDFGVMKDKQSLTFNSFQVQSMFVFDVFCYTRIPSVQ